MKNTNAIVFLLIFICSSYFTMQLYAMEDENRKLIEKAIASARTPEDLNKSISKFYVWLVLNMAAYNDKDHDLLVILLQRGADITFTGKYRRSAMHDAAYYRAIKSLTTLIDHAKKKYSTTYKTIINYQDSSKETALHHAANAGFFEGVEALLHAQADPNIKNHCGNTALHFVASNDSSLVIPRIIKLLYLYGADVMTWNNDGFTPEAAALNVRNSGLATQLNAQLLQKLLPCESRIQHIRKLHCKSDSYFSLLPGDLIASLRQFIIAQHIIQLEDDEPNEKRLFKRQA